MRLSVIEMSLDEDLADPPSRGLHRDGGPDRLTARRSPARGPCEPVIATVSAGLGCATARVNSSGLGRRRAVPSLGHGRDVFGSHDMQRA